MAAAAAASRCGRGSNCFQAGSRSRCPGRVLVLIIPLLALFANVYAVGVSDESTAKNILPKTDAEDSHLSNAHPRSNTYSPRARNLGASVLVPRSIPASRTVNTHNNKKRATPSIPSPTAQVTTGPSSSPIRCPTDNLTVFTEPTESKRYVILCGRDYHSNLGAKELRNLETNSLKECIDVCAQDTTGCSAVGWGYHEYYRSNRCFLKSSIGQSHDSATWVVAVEDPSQPGSRTFSEPHGLSVDTKAGIGVGVASAIVLIGAGLVCAWYYPKRKSAVDGMALEENKEISETSSSIGYNGSYRTHSPTPPAFQQQPIYQMPAGECPELLGSPVSFASEAPNSSGVDDDSPSAGVSSYLARQQRSILDSCRPARSRDGPRLAAIAHEIGDQQWPATYTVFSPDGTLAPMSAATWHGTFAPSPWSATAPSSASELPVAHQGGRQGYGPEYEMPSTVAATVHRGGVDAEKFLLSDVILLKARLASEKRDG